MVSETPSLTDRALSRLRKLAAGNGVDPRKIEVTGTEEKTYRLEGILTLEPKSEAQTVRYPGPPRGQGRKILRGFAALHAEAAKQRENFAEGSGWVDLALKELKSAPGEGWGLEGAQVTSDGMKPIILAASENCPACQGRKLLTCQQCGGQGSVICPHCQGRRQEPCIGCGGTGINPTQPGQPCPICNGSRFTACRYCRAMGQLTCPTCHGRRGVPCNVCNGSGLITEEIALSSAVETHFRIKSTELPSGLRRGLDRLGIANLGKGHADIVMVHGKAQNHEEELKKAHEDERKNKTAVHTVHYEATLPYADIRMNFFGKKAIVSAFGKKGALLGVPAFLDTALDPAREKLREAVHGLAPLDAALDVRLMREALELELAGHGSVAELRKIYPLGLSNEAAKEILRNLHLALNRLTLKLRRIAAGASVALAAVLFGALFHTPLHAQITGNWSSGMAALFDAALLAAMLLLSAVALNASAYLALEKRFPQQRVSKIRKPGKTGFGMLAAIILMFAFMLLTAPEKPVWLLHLLN